MKPYDYYTRLRCKGNVQTSTYGFKLYCIARIIIHKHCFLKNHYEFLSLCFAQSNTFTESNKDARGQLAHLQDEKTIL